MAEVARVNGRRKWRGWTTTQPVTVRVVSGGDRCGGAVRRDRRRRCWQRVRMGGGALGSCRLGRWFEFSGGCPVAADGGAAVHSTTDMLRADGDGTCGGCAAGGLSGDGGRWRYWTRAVGRPCALIAVGGASHRRGWRRTGGSLRNWARVDAVVRRCRCGGGRSGDRRRWCWTRAVGRARRLVAVGGASHGPGRRHTVDRCGLVSGCRGARERQWRVPAVGKSCGLVAVGWAKSRARAESHGWTAVELGTGGLRGAGEGAGGAAG